MTSARRDTRQALDQMLMQPPVPSPTEMNSRLDRMWERLQAEIEYMPTEHVSISVSIRPRWELGKAPSVVAGVVLAAILVSVLVWRLEPPSPTAFRPSTSNDPALSRSPSQRGVETLQLTVPGDKFELASVKLVQPSSDAFKVASMGESTQSMSIGCPGGYAYTTQITPGRLTIPGATVLSLVMLAYGRDCTLVDGGPAWARSGEYYEIQALLPEGVPRETIGALLKGEAPRLQGMLQNLLADRFHLVLRRELRETPVYKLTIAKPGKLTLSRDETLPLPAGIPALPGIPPMTVARGQLFRLPGTLFGHAVSTSDLARELRLFAGRVVVDKTGLNQVFDVDLKFAMNIGAPSTAALPASSQSIPPLPPPGTSPQAAPISQGASLQDALEDQLGLKMEDTRMPIEVLVIESVERPASN